MNSDELRAVQAPLKARYKDEELRSLLRLTEPYCAVYQRLAHSPQISVELA